MYTYTKSRPVHEALKRLCCITEAEGHPEELEESKGRGDSRLGDILWGHWDLVVGPD